MNKNYLLSSPSLSSSSTAGSSSSNLSSTNTNLNEEISLKKRVDTILVKSSENNPLVIDTPNLNYDEAKATSAIGLEEVTAASSSKASSSNAAPCSNTSAFSNSFFGSAHTENLVNYNNTIKYSNTFNNNVSNMLPSIQQQQQQQQQQSQFMPIASNLPGMVPGQMTPIQLHQQHQTIPSSTIQPMLSNNMMMPVGYQQATPQMSTHSSYQMNYPYFYQQQQQHNFYNNIYGGGVQPQYINGQLLSSNIIGPPAGIPQSHNILPPPPVSTPMSSNGTAISHNINDLLKPSSDQLNNQIQKSDSNNSNTNSSSSPTTKTNGPSTPKSRKKSEVND
jgi:hypothetical protein